MTTEEHIKAIRAIRTLAPTQPHAVRRAMLAQAEAIGCLLQGFGRHGPDVIEELAALPPGTMLTISYETPAPGIGAVIGTPRVA